MSTAKELYQLQEVDLEIDAKVASLDRIEGQLGESEAVAEAQRRIEEMRSTLRELEGRQREEELVSQSIQAKAEAAEKKLYGGSVRNPRELSDMQDELGHLKARQSQHDDVILDIMAQGEVVQKEMGRQLDELRRMEAEWYQGQERLFRERDQLRSELVALEEARSAKVATIDAESLSRYESLRLSKQGVAVAKVERGMCQGCRISLPMNELQKARTGRSLVKCSSCGRILYVS